MKIALSLGLALLACTTGRADIFRPVAIRGGARGELHRPVFHGGHRPYSFYGSSYRFGAYRYFDGYGYDYPYAYTGSGSAAANGLWLGALAGGIIGHNSGGFRHDAWRGAAWGAGLGWLLGSVADANRPAVTYAAPAMVTTAYATPAALPAAVMLPAPASPALGAGASRAPVAPTAMSGANALFGR